MSTIKRMALVLATVGMVSTQAYAGESAVKTTPLSPQLSAFSQDDINKPMQLAALSTQEMKETEGAFVPAVIGAYYAVAPYIPAMAVAAVHYGPRMGVAIDRFNSFWHARFYGLGR